MISHSIIILLILITIIYFSKNKINFSISSIKEHFIPLFNKKYIENFNNVYANNTIKQLSTLLSPKNKKIQSTSHIPQNKNEIIQEVSDKSIYDANIVPYGSRKNGYNNANLNPPTYMTTTGFSNNFLYERGVNNLFTSKYKDFKLIQQDNSIPNTIHRDVLKGIIEITPLSDLFFGSENIEQLQNEIISQVYEKSNNLYKISKQNETELVVIMRAIFLQYSKNLPYNFEDQICELNKQVLLQAVPKIMVQIEATLGYERDAGQLIRPLPLPMYVSTAGTKTNRSVSSLFI